MLKIIKNINLFILLLSFTMFTTVVSIDASVQNQANLNNFNDLCVNDFRNINDSIMIENVEVVYDGAWYGMRAANVPRIINIAVVCSGTGILSNPMYNCTLKVALEIRYNSDTMKITSVGKPDVYYYSAPGAPQNAKNPRATAVITNSGKSVKITGYIDYTASIYAQTFTGSRTYYL